jgi:hypothetical protein
MGLLGLAALSRTLPPPAGGREQGSLGPGPAEQRRTAF